MAKKYDEILLLDYVEGELDAPGVAKVQAWMRADARLERVLRQMIADRQALRRLPDPPAPAWIMEEVDRQLEREMLMGDLRPASDPSDRFRLAGWAARLALAAMLAVVTGWVVWSLIPEKTWQPPASVAVVPVENVPTPIAVQPTPEPPPIVREPAPKPAVAQTAPPVEPPTEVASQPVETPPLSWTVDLDRVLAPLREAAAVVTRAEPKPDEPTKPQPATTFARVEGPREKVEFPGAATPRGTEVKGDKELTEFISLLTRRPALAARCRLEIVTRDAAKARAKLAELSGAPGDPPIEPRLRVTPAGLPGAIAALLEDPVHLSVRLLGPGDAPATPPEEPDYTEILLDQLNAATARKDRDPTITIPVVIRGQ